MRSISMLVLAGERKSIFVDVQRVSCFPLCLLRLVNVGYTHEFILCSE